MNKYDIFSAFEINNKIGDKANTSKYNLPTKLPFIRTTQFKKEPMSTSHKTKSKNARFANLSLSIENNNNFLKIKNKKLTFNNKSNLTSLKFGNFVNLTNDIKTLTSSPKKINSDNLLNSDSDQNLFFSFETKKAKSLTKFSDCRSANSCIESVNLPKNNKEILRLKVFRYLNTNEEKINKDNNNLDNEKKNVIAPNFMLIDKKLRKKYLNLANEYCKENSSEKVNESIKSNLSKNNSQNSSFSEIEDYNKQNKIIAQKILYEERKKEKKRSIFRLMNLNEIEFGHKFEIDKNQLKKLILEHSNNMFKKNVASINKLIKSYNRYFTRKELYNNQKIRMNSLRTKSIIDKHKEDL